MANLMLLEGRTRNHEGFSYGLKAPEAAPLQNLSRSGSEGRKAGYKCIETLPLVPAPLPRSYWYVAAFCFCTWWFQPSRQIGNALSLCLKGFKGARQCLKQSLGCCVVFLVFSVFSVVWAPCHNSAEPQWVLIMWYLQVSGSTHASWKAQLVSRGSSRFLAYQECGHEIKCHTAHGVKGALLADMLS